MSNSSLLSSIHQTSQALLEAMANTDRTLANARRVSYNHKTVAELRSLAKSQGLKGYSKLGKEALIDLILG